MRGYTTQDKISYWIFQDRVPVVKLLIVANVVTFLAMELFRIGLVPQLLAFSPGRAIAMPWTLFTYPLLGVGGVVSLLFAGWWLWFAGGSLERAWGSRTFGLYFFLMSAVTALGLYIGGLLTGVPVGAEGLWLPIAGVTVAFGMMNPEQQILFFFVIPLKLKYLALIDAAIVLVQYGSMNPLLGVFALAGCGVSYWYVRGGISIQLPTARPPRGEVIRVNPRYAVRKSWNPIKRYRDYRARKRLEDLFKE
jgi:membrane associated rhomboid family serine protease